MEVLKGVLREELENSERRLAAFEKALQKLPKGSLQRKVIRGREYYYRVYWNPQAQKNIFVLLDRDLPKEVIEAYRKAKEQRASYRNQIRVLKLEIRLLKRMLHAREFSIAEKYSRAA
jgi:hypothetical protein